MSRRIRLDAIEAAQRLATAPPATKKRLRQALRQLAEDPTGASAGVDVKPLEPVGDFPQAFRARVGDWRIVFIARPRLLEVLRIFPRSEGYGWMERRA